VVFLLPHDAKRGQPLWEGSQIDRRVGRVAVPSQLHVSTTSVNQDPVMMTDHNCRPQQQQQQQQHQQQQNHFSCCCCCSVGVGRGYNVLSRHIVRFN
jgi:hypothetical protein